MKTELLEWFRTQKNPTDEQARTKAIDIQEEAQSLRIANRTAGVGSQKKPPEMIVPQAKGLQEFVSSISPNATPESIAQHRKRVEALATRHGIPLKDHQKDALASFAEGGGQLDRLLVKGRNADDIAEAMVRYRNRNGRRDEGLEQRRLKELGLFRKGYPAA